jgi:outer membrane autotransporter protein
VTGASIGRNAALVGIGLQAASGKNWSVSATLQGQFSGGYRAYGGKLAMGYRW